MKKLTQDNSRARELQSKLLNTNVSNERYDRLCINFGIALEGLPSEGKRLNENGFLIPWRENH